MFAFFVNPNIGHNKDINDNFAKFDEVIRDLNAVSGYLTADEVSFFISINRLAGQEIFTLMNGNSKDFHCIVQYTVALEDILNSVRERIAAHRNGR